MFMRYVFSGKAFKLWMVLPLLMITLFAAKSAADAAPVKILLFGDSLAAGYGLPPEQGLAARLEAELRARGVDAEVINAGVSGDTTAGGRARLDWALAGEPDYAIVELGGNDGLRGLDPADTRANLEAIIERLKQENVGILLTGMYAPPNLGEDYGRKFNAVFPELAEKYGLPFYPFILEGVAAEPELNQPDGIHPNARGVGVIVDRLTPHVLKLIGAEG
jgi:acyl-CoA thioesterase-1